MESLWKAIQNETETDTLNYQIQALKDIIDEIGNDFMSQEIVDALAVKIIDMYRKSDARIEENNMIAKKDEGVEEDEEDDEEDDKEMIKEENRSEYDLQFSLSEIIGTIFKTHSTKVNNLLQTLFNEILYQALQLNVKDKTKFVIFILDDMVEFLGPHILG